MTRPDPQRRRLLGAMAAGGALAAVNPLLPAHAGTARRSRAGTTAGTAAAVPGGCPRPVDMSLGIRRQAVHIAGRRGHATSVDQTVPGPLVELWEGHDAVLRVTNHMDADSSIHWHGIMLPFEMDGVPGVTFPGIPPGETFVARFPVRQYGTYWYHSHSGLQEQTGTYGPLVIHPRTPDPFPYDRDYVVMLSDWTFENPHRVLARLKTMSDYYNYHQRTVGDFVRDAGRQGLKAAVDERLMWGDMRMSPTDIADVTGATYTYLMNGLPPDGNWTGLFRPGERVRLRLINGSAMTYFNVRIPGLVMTVVQADGQNVEPVDTDELQIAVAETFDVIVAPAADRAYTLMAESMDRSGYVRGTLATRPGMSAAVPKLRRPPRRSMRDMGMAMSMPMKDGAGTSGMDHTDHTDHMGGMDHPGRGAGNAVMGRSRLAEPGAGLEDVGHRVLTYAQLRNPLPMRDRRKPSRTFELHLTGNMQRYMWSFDGKTFHEVASPIDFPYGERVRLVLVNDTMMEHPIHLHGMFMELENGQGDRLPFKHTISVRPAERVSLLITADQPGRWAFHCHLLYHMVAGMFRVVRINGPEA